MARSSPWSVKGVDQDARQIAREAAKRHGLTIGAWVDRAIKKRAEKPTPQSALETPTELDTAIDTSAPAPVSEIVEQPPTASPDNVPSTNSTGIGFDVEQALKSARGQTNEASDEDALTNGLGGQPTHADTDIIIAASENSKSGRFSRIGLLGSAVVAAIAGGIWIYENNLSQVSSSPQQVATKKPNAKKPAASQAPTELAAKIPPAISTPAIIEKTPAPAKPEKPPQATKTIVATKTKSPPAPISKANHLKNIKQQAATGDHNAQFELANRYLSGKGVPKSPKQAVAWLNKAANGGIIPAQYNLGLLYELGNGVTKNPSQAIAWYRKAADKGHARAQHNLGTLYAQGNGAPKDYKSAAYWFKKGSENGLADSMHSLGLMHEHGLGVTKNTKIATAYYNKALAAGSAEAAKKLKRTNLATNRTPTTAEITKAASTTPAAGSSNTGGLNKVGIANIQRLLARLDLTPGTPDGVMGKKTEEAIKMYQRFAGLAVDGKPTSSLLSDLRQVVGAMAPVKAAAPTPSER
ncbi:MAG: hypothetical protein GKS01_13990 [Alphaproteobacteria bacterium]|nr:hypothetical protein [Alphaproteobacteria bacterium]